jgi:hypothetical protein
LPLSAQVLAIFGQSQASWPSSVASLLNGAPFYSRRSTLCGLR